MKFCKDCNVELTENNCYKKYDNYLRPYCKICQNKRSATYDKIRSKKSSRKQYQLDKRKLDRKNPAKSAQFILTDSKKSDKNNNRENDLTKEFIKDTIANGCCYCGESELRMTLDRIDNNIGHLQSNVVPACIRCNYARRSMPYQAWLCLIEGMKEARIKGLFEGWTGRCR